MPKLEYFLVCESMSTDSETNRVSLFNVLEDLQVASPESTSVSHIPVAQFVAVSCWNQERGDEVEDFQAIVKIHPPNGEPQQFTTNFKMEQPRQRLAFRIQGVPKLEPGQLKFELLINGEHIAWHTVNIHPPKT